ncbi:MAG: RDD family protein [Actinomycetota bacterium]|nr:RDD family protein [Actinomycetota bacterium]
MQYEDRLTISTPEGVEIELSLAGLGSRLSAAVIDALIKFALTLAILFTLGGVSASTMDDSNMNYLALAGVILAIFLTTFGYDIFFEAFASGRTPGKAALGIRVVREGGRPCGFLAATIRNVMRLVDFLPSGYLIGIVSVLATAKNQRVGDIAAGTIVVRDRNAPAYRGSIGTPAAPPSAAPPSVSGWDVSAITPDELSAVRSFLERRFELDPEARYRLGWELAERLRPKVGGAEQSHPEFFLEQLAATKTARM